MKHEQRSQTLVLGFRMNKRDRQVEIATTSLQTDNIKQTGLKIKGCMHRWELLYSSERTTSTGWTPSTPIGAVRVEYTNRHWPTCYHLSFKLLSLNYPNYSTPFKVDQASKVCPSTSVVKNLGSFDWVDQHPATYNSQKSIHKHLQSNPLGYHK